MTVVVSILLSVLGILSAQARTWQPRPPAPRLCQPTCMATRYDTQVNLLHDEQQAMAHGLGRAYTGRGVLVGIVDIGIEYGHLNFRNPETGQSRLSAAVLYRAAEGKPDEVREYYDDALSLDTLTTDTYNNAHGTHTAGIAAGSYPELGQQGMAPEADLMLCGTSSLTDERLIDAIRQIFDRADELDVPCVVNLSIGNPVDWKDGLTPFCLACDSLTDGGNAPGRVIVLSAGNDGAKCFTVGHEFEDEEPVYALLQPCDYQKKTAYLNPNFDVYASDSLPLSLDFVLYDTLSHHFAECPFEQHLLDTLEAGHSGRRHLILDADTCLLGAYPNQLLAARLSGRRGSSVTAYYINDMSVQYAILPGPDPTWLRGTPDYSISDLCCTDAVISVGAYSAVDTVVNVFDYHIPSWAPAGEVCSFSSYGLTSQGVAKPDVLCPGASVISGLSSFSTAQVEYYYTSRRYLASPMMYVVKPEEGDSPWYRPEEPDRTYYWIHSVGTSQSSPAMAGIIALWLEACPTLSVRDVRDIVRRTSRFDDYCLAAPSHLMQAGNGKADALAGMREVLNRMEGIECVRQEGPKAEDCYDLMGRRVRPGRASSPVFVVSRSSTRYYRVH